MSMEKKHGTWHFELNVPIEEEKRKVAEKIKRGETENILVIHEYPDGTCLVVS